MTNPEVIESVLAIIEDDLGLPRPQPDTDLLAEGILDSLSVLDLLAEIENRLGVVVDLTKLELSDLESIEALAELVERNR